MFFVQHQHFQDISSVFSDTFFGAFFGSLFALFFSFIKDWLDARKKRNSNYNEELIFIERYLIQILNEINTLEFEINKLSTQLAQNKGSPIPMISFNQLSRIETHDFKLSKLLNLELLNQFATVCFKVSELNRISEGIDSAHKEMRGFVSSGINDLASVNTYKGGVLGLVESLKDVLIFSKKLKDEIIDTLARNQAALMKMPKNWLSAYIWNAGKIKISEKEISGARKKIAQNQTS